MVDVEPTPSVWTVLATSLASVTERGGSWLANAGPLSWIALLVPMISMLVVHFWIEKSNRPFHPVKPTLIYAVGAALFLVLYTLDKDRSPSGFYILTVSGLWLLITTIVYVYYQRLSRQRG